jgi:hypothetical protein
LRPIVVNHSKRKTWTQDSVGETPTDASETLALPGKSLRFGEFLTSSEIGSLCAVIRYVTHSQQFAENILPILFVIERSGVYFQRGY